jgi:hypothetical protein
MQGQTTDEAPTQSLRKTTHADVRANRLLPKREAQVGVDELVDALAHVADEGIVGSWLVYQERPTQVGALASKVWPWQPELAPP